MEAPWGATALHSLSNDVCMLRLNKGAMHFIHKAIKFFHLPHLLPRKPVAKANNHFLWVACQGCCSLQPHCPVTALTLQTETHYLDC